MRSILLVMVGLSACRPDDVKGDTSDPGETGETADSGDTEDSGDTDDTSAADALLTDGVWLSEGDNISYLLQQYNFNSITATFNIDGSYEVVAARSAGAPVTLSGTYGLDASTDPTSIELAQVSPYEDTASGIFDIERSTMRYEVLSGSSAGTCTGPTPETGFGSTSCPGEDYPDNFNLQIFVLQQ